VWYRPLGANGPPVSAIGFGAAPLGGEFGERPRVGTAIRAVDCAIDLGMNVFDVSPYYGRTLAETRLGIALKGKRHRVVLATKCGRYVLPEFDFSRSRIRASIDESLARLRTDNVDLPQAHDVEFGDERQIVEGASALDYEPAPELIQQMEQIVARLKMRIWPWRKPEYDDYESNRFPDERRN
jgi:L-galactose dehydrogenase